MSTRPRKAQEEKVILVTDYLENVSMPSYDSQIGRTGHPGCHSYS